MQLTGLADRNNQRDSAQHGVERLAGVRHVNNRIELASRQAILTWVGMAAINLNHFVIAGLTQSVLSAADAPMGGVRGRCAVGYVGGWVAATGVLTPLPEKVSGSPRLETVQLWPGIARMSGGLW